MSSVNARVPPLRLMAVDTPSNGQVAAYQSSSGDFEWVDNGGGGSFTSFTVAGDAGANQTITDGNTLTLQGSGGVTKVTMSATDTATFSLENTSVSAGSYTYASITVDAQGRLTAASSGTAPSDTTYDLVAAQSGSDADIQLDASSGTDTAVKLAAGSNITLTESGGDTITIASSGGASGANPTATVSGSATNGSASTFMRSDAAPALADTAVTPGSYTYSAITVDAQGRLTAASSGTAPASSANPTATVSGSATNGSASTFMRSDAAPALADTAVTPGSYTYSAITVDAQGRLTAASSGTAPSDTTYDLVAAQSGSDADIQLDASSGTDTAVKLAAGSNITLTESGGDTITIAASGGSVTFPLEGTDGSASAPTYSFSSDTNNGMYLSATDTLALASGGLPKLVMDGAAVKVESNVRLSISDGQESNPGLRFGDDTNTGIWRSAADTIDFSVNGDARLQLSTTELKMGNGSENFKLSLNGSSDSYLNMQNGSNVQLYSSGGIYLNAHAGNNLIRANAITTTLGNTNVDAVLTTQGTGDLTLSTNSGTNSGTIVIRDGAGQDIEITPNGSGVINLDGLKWPSADGSANQVLKTDGAGTLSFTDAGGGVTGAIDAVKPTVSNASGTTDVSWANTEYPFGNTVTTTQTINTNQPIYIPFIARRTDTLDKGYLQVTTGAGSATNAKIGVYSSSNGAPNTLLGSATVDVTSTGTLNGTLSAEAGQSLATTAGTQYWLGLVRDAANDFTIGASDVTYSGAMAWRGTYNGAYGVLSQSGSDNTLPATAAFTTGFAYELIAIGVAY